MPHRIQVIETIISQTTSVIFVSAAIIYNQTSEVLGPIVSTAFDQLFSLGLLVIGIAILAFWYRLEKKVNERLHNQVASLVEQTNRLNKNLVQELNDLKKEIRSR